LKNCNPYLRILIRWRRQLSGLVSSLLDEALDGDVDELVLQVGLHEAGPLPTKVLYRPEHVDLGVETCPQHRARAPLYNAEQVDIACCC